MRGLVITPLQPQLQLRPPKPAIITNHHHHHQPPPLTGHHLIQACQCQRSTTPGTNHHQRTSTPTHLTAPETQPQLPVAQRRMTMEKGSHVSQTSVTCPGCQDQVSPHSKASVHNKHLQGAHQLWLVLAQANRSHP